MSFSPGTRLGPYEVVAPIGAGGMGEVYRARDSRLGREVAVKVLPASFSQDADRLRRFEQEARAASALNHPGIVTLHDVGANDGAPYVVTELLEGETLRARLATGALSPRKATEYAIQIANGLAAAHEKGIVHRDLKPENLFVTEDGRVKILDFGLAKLIQPDGGAAQQQTSVPTASAGTEPGVVMGTVGYMSPEQVKGLPADHRSDIFSFGAILYEMLSGRRAFRGDSAVETMTAILKEDPPDLSETNKRLSPGLDRLVRHCLEKSPAQRFQSARDLAYDLESLSTSSSTPRELTPHSVSRGLPLRRLALAAALAGACLAGWFLAKRMSPSDVSPKYRTLTFQRGFIGNARFAPDGSTVVYSASWNGRPSRVFSTTSGSTESRDLDLPAGALLAVSSSGELAIATGKNNYDSLGTLATVPLAGGTPRELQEGVRLADWSPDGKALAIVRVAGGSESLEYPVGKKIYETPNQVDIIRFSPRGDSIASLEEDTSGFAQVNLVDLSGKKRTLTSGLPSSHGMAWRSDGREIWFSASPAGASFEEQVYAMDLSGRVRLVRRETQRLILADVAPDGRALLQSTNTVNATVGVLASDPSPRDLSWQDFSEADAISADGQLLLFDEWGRAGGANGAFYVRRASESGAIRLGEGTGLAISEDGRRVFASTPDGLAIVPIGPGSTRNLGGKGLQVSFWGGCLDGDTTAYFKGNRPGEIYRLFKIPLSGGSIAPISGNVGSGPIALSPDGKLIASDGPDGKIALYPVDGGAARPLPGSRMDEHPVRFTPDGRFLYVYETVAVPAKVYRIDIASGRRDLWKEVAPADTAGVFRIARVVTSADGRFYAYSFGRELVTLVLAEGLR